MVVKTCQTHSTCETNHSSLKGHQGNHFSSSLPSPCSKHKKHHFRSPLAPPAELQVNTPELC